MEIFIYLIKYYIDDPDACDIDALSRCSASPSISFSWSLVSSGPIFPTHTQTVLGVGFRCESIIYVLQTQINYVFACEMEHGRHHFFLFRVAKNANRRKFHFRWEFRKRYCICMRFVFLFSMASLLTWRMHRRRTSCTNIRVYAKWKYRIPECNVLAAGVWTICERDLLPHLHNAMIESFSVRLISSTSFVRMLKEF